ncbi:hypothetical protein SLEP1_g17862 [Rubroshorea leprosula]|uniref:Uncharacterized protein n=1 Tax=Rubroshorea leprosula TaxID=152421 RepID=A0AAV5J373_9ROSI|nr:hypothetical protein SLEP1_g17862 [Rubroshorea leprosula]
MKFDKLKQEMPVECSMIQPKCAVHELAFSFKLGTLSIGCHSLNPHVG